MTVLMAAELQLATNIAADRIVNTFCVVGDTGELLENAQAVADAITDHYSDAPATPGISTINEYLSDDLVRGSAVNAIKMYDIDDHLDGSPHGSPIWENTWILPTIGMGGTSLPHEVAVKCRLEAFGRAAAPVETPDGPDAGTAVDRPQQRLTGGVYYGPLQSVAVTQADGFARPAPTFRMVVVNAIKDINADLDALPTIAYLGVWSRKNANVHKVEFAKVDDAFDTQRRRGIKPSTATSLDVHFT